MRTENHLQTCKKASNNYPHTQVRAMDCSYLWSALSAHLALSINTEKVIYTIFALQQKKNKKQKTQSHHISAGRCFIQESDNYLDYFNVAASPSLIMHLVESFFFFF